MAKDVKFNIKISVDGKEKIVSATTSVSDLQRVMDQAKGSAGQLRDKLLAYTQTVQSIQSITGDP